MGIIVNLDDSPMFQKQVKSMEQSADQLKNRCEKLSEGCNQFLAALEESCHGYHAFADCLEEFGGGRDDPVSISIGGPVMSKFISALRELATCKELLRSQVEHTLLDRMDQFLTVDMHDSKESREHYDNALHSYDQAREKFMSLKKNTPEDIVAGLEEDMEDSKAAFEKSRFHLVSELMNVESKKKYEFLEFISAMMDAHLRFFKLGYDLLSRMEPYVYQVLTYAHQSKELANVEQHKLEKRIQEFRAQAELTNTVAFSDMAPSDSTDDNNVAGKSTFKNVEEMMQATTTGEVKTIKRGYLLKRSSNGDWKRRFFVLDSQGTLYYYRTNGTSHMGLASYHSSSSFDPHSSMFSIFCGRHNRSPSLDDEVKGCRTVDLQTSTIKSEADDTDLRLCFKIVSPAKTYTLQAENGADRLDWINKITAVITSLLNTNFLQQTQPASTNGMALNSIYNDDQGSDGYDSVNVDQGVSVSKTLREVAGNEHCAECNSPDPDWASLNLGILLCIECSGVHRNLGVHISKVRSLSLDVKVWEPAILELFRSLGNTYCNSIWEGLLHLDKESVERKDDEANSIQSVIKKPCPMDNASTKEKYIHAKYVDKSLVGGEASASDISANMSIWKAVKSSNVREVYRLIVMRDANVNTTFDDVIDPELYHHVEAQESEELECETVERKNNDPATCQRIMSSHESGGSCFQGCSLLHVACHIGNQVMVELLMQFGANTNLLDYHGRTPLHHCIAGEHNELAKSLIRRGACPSVRDGGGKTALERAMVLGAVTDERLFIMLTESGGACPSVRDGGGKTALERAMVLGAVTDERLFIMLTESG